MPVSTSGQGSAYQKFAHPASRYAVVGVAAALTVTSGLCREASVSVGGVVPAPARASSVERALVGQALSAETISAAAQSVGDDLGDDADLLGDIFRVGRVSQGSDSYLGTTRGGLGSGTRWIMKPASIDDLQSSLGGIERAQGWRRGCSNIVYRPGGARDLWSSAIG